MEYIYAPWRSEYFGNKKDSCVFCDIAKGINLHSNTQESFAKADEANRVFYRDDKIFCVMNKFPYTPGHFLIIPHTHTHSPELFDLQTWLHLQTFAKNGIALLKELGIADFKLLSSSKVNELEYGALSGFNLRILECIEV